LALAAKATPSGSTATQVDLLGDAAAIARQASRRQGGIFVLKGDVLLTVVYDGGTRPTDAALELAATAALAALPHVPR
jgi:hypothetical protein